MTLRGNRPFAPSRRAVLAGVGAVASTFSIAACQRSEAPVDPDGRIRLRFATDARAGAEHGGFYQALASNAYAKRGLNVQIVQGGPGVNVPELLASNTVELGLASDSLTPLNLVAEGAPVRAVAAYFQKEPRVLIAHPDPDVTDIADLAERPLMLSEGARQSLWPWLKARHGFTDDQLVPFEADLATFLADDQAVRDGALTVDPARVEAVDFVPRTFVPADEGYPSYGALVLAPNGFARDNAKALRDFIAASAEGWRDYIQGDAASVSVRAAEALIRKDNPDMTQAELIQARARLKAAGIVDGGDAALYGLGAMTDERWKAFFDMMSQAGVYPGGLDWRRAFTTQYLPGRG